MELIIAAASFVLGYFAEKLLDKIFEKTGRKLRLSRVRKRVAAEERAIKDENIAVLPLIHANPPFTPDLLEVEVDRRAVMYIAFPDALRPRLMASSGAFPTEDVFFSAPTISGIAPEAFSAALEAARMKVAEGFVNRTGGMYYNGPSYGLMYADGFSRTCDGVELPILTMKLFKTDYFTHKVMEETLEAFRTELTPFTVDRLNSELSFIRTSMGVSIIVVLRSSDEILMTRRSVNSSYTEGKTWIYVSATEAFSTTDYDAYTRRARLDLCVRRGLLEELAITEDMYSAEDMVFTDTFFETHFMQDGVVAVVRLNERCTFTDIKTNLRKAKDCDLEIESLFVIDNDRKAIGEFVEANKDEMRDQTRFALKCYAARL